MPLWKKTTTICAALLISAPFASESLAQRLSPLTPLPMPSLSAPENAGAEAQKSIFELAPEAPVRRLTRSYNPLKPMAAPDAPIVKLAKRPVFNPSGRSNAVPVIATAVKQNIEQVKSSRLSLRPVGSAAAALANQVKDLAKESANQAKESAKNASVSPVAEANLPAVVAEAKPSEKITPLASTAPVATTKTAVGVTNDFPLAAATPSVVVRSPFVQPGNPNRYLFVVENIGTVDAASTRVDLRVPAGVILKQVVADSASSTARHAIVRIDELKAGAKSILEVEIQPTNVDVTFETSLTLETKRSFRGATLPKRGIASSVPTAASAMESATSNVATQVSYKGAASTGSTASAEATASTGTAPSTVDANLSANVEGPVMLAAGETGDFAIVVKNPNRGEASRIVVQLSIPKGLKITTLDREAWINDDDNTISWELSSLGAGQEEAIQYKAVGKTTGQQVQKVTLGMADVYQGDAKLVTLVSQ